MHPFEGMTLSRSVPPTVGELMRGHFVTSDPEDNLLEADRAMQLARLRQLLVAKDGILLGLLPQRPMLEAWLMALLLRSRSEAFEYLRSRRVSEAMLPAPPSVAPGSSLEEAALKLLERDIACLPVVEESSKGPRLVGLVTESDLLKAAYV